MRSFRLILLGFLLLSIASDLFGQKNPKSISEIDLIDAKKLTYEQIIPFFRANRLELAEQLFLRSLKREKDSARIAMVHAWLAATYREQYNALYDRNDLTPEQYSDEASKVSAELIDHLYAALEYDDCNGIALSIVGDIYDWNTGLSLYNDQDLAWRYLMRAVECDSNQGNAWIGMLHMANERGDVEMERVGYVRLVESGFVPKPILDYSRWLLQSLPDSAILFAWGDMDFYPIVGLQHSEGLRPDVAVISLAALNARWYVLKVGERYGLPLPDSLPPAFDDMEEDGEYLVNGDSILAWWMKWGQLERPVTAVVSFRNRFGKLCEIIVDYGLFVRRVSPLWLDKNRKALVVDEGTLSRPPSEYYHCQSLDGLYDSLTRNNLAGPIVSEGDYSAIRARSLGSACSGAFALTYYCDVLSAAPNADSNHAKILEMLSLSEAIVNSQKKFAWHREALDVSDEFLLYAESVRRSIEMERESDK